MARTMKDSGVEWIGLVPDNWKVLRNKNCFELEKNIVGDAFNQYELLSLTKKGIVKKDIDNAFGKTPESYSTYQSVKKGQIVMCLFDLDISAVFSGLSEYDGMISPAYKTYNCKKDMLNSYAKYWFEYCFDGRKYKIYSKSLRYVVNAEDFGGIEILIPPMEEQKKIVDFLDEKLYEINSIISETQETIEQYKKYKNAIITETITQGLDKEVIYRNTDIEYIETIPAHWDVLRLRFLGSCQNGISKSSEAFGSGYPFVSYGDVYRNYELPEVIAGQIESTECERENYSVKYGDVFFTRTSETIEEVGFTSTCLKTIENAVFAGFVIRFRPFNNEKLSPRFSKYYFRSDMHRRFFVKEMNLVTRASLSQELLKKLPVLLPPMEEQEAIADYLDAKCGEIDALIAKKEAFIEEMETYKKSLVYEYVTGKKEVV